MKSSREVARRHRISNDRDMPYRRAVAEICRGVRKLSRTILSFSSSDQRRRRLVSSCLLVILEAYLRFNG